LGRYLLSKKSNADRGPDEFSVSGLPNSVDNGNREAIIKLFLIFLNIFIAQI
jgi:hypothetical protein